MDWKTDKDIIESQLLEMLSVIQTGEFSDGSPCDLSQADQLGVLDGLQESRRALGLLDKMGHGKFMDHGAQSNDR